MQNNREKKDEVVMGRRRHRMEVYPMLRVLKTCVPCRLEQHVFLERIEMRNYRTENMRTLEQAAVFRPQPVPVSLLCFCLLWWQPTALNLSLSLWPSPSVSVSYSGSLPASTRPWLCASFLVCFFPCRACKPLCMQWSQSQWQLWLYPARRVSLLARGPCSTLHTST